MSGKSHWIIEFIQNYVKKKEAQIFYVTNLGKNENNNDFVNFLEKNKYYYQCFGEEQINDGLFYNIYQYLLNDNTMRDKMDMNKQSKVYRLLILDDIQFDNKKQQI